MSDPLEYGLGIGLMPGMLPEFYQFLEDVVNIGQVKVPCQGQGPVLIHRIPNDGMTMADIIGAMCPITQMAHHHFTRMRKFLFEEFCFLMIVRILSGKFGQFLINLGKQTCPGGSVVVPFPEHVAVSGFDIQLHRNEAGTILPSVPLFFHQEVHFVKAPKSGPVLLLIIFQGFE